jgi:uncharacterized protein YpmS
MITIILFLILITLVNIGFVLVKSYVLLHNINKHNFQQQSESITQAVQEQKSRKEPLKAVKRIIRGRSVTKSEDLVDLSELSFEEGYKAVEDIGNV